MKSIDIKINYILINTQELIRATIHFGNIFLIWLIQVHLLHIYVILLCLLQSFINSKHLFGKLTTNLNKLRVATKLV